MVLGADGMDALRRSHVAVFGLGGVGSYAVEALVRSGVGELTLIDDDTVALTNLNRQLEALHSTLGQSKAEAIAARCRDINPAVVLHPIVGRYEAAGRERFFDAKYDYILDCIDLVSCKLDLIETALTRGIPILSALGTGNKLDPSRFRVCDINKTSVCPLARVMRRELKKQDRQLRYIAITSDQNGETGELVRIHHHILIPCEGIEMRGGKLWIGEKTLESVWKNGNVDYQPLRSQEDYTPLAEYLMRQVRRKPDASKYKASRNLAKPVLVSERLVYAAKELQTPKGAKIVYRAAYTPGEPVNLREWFAREEKNAAASVDTHAVEKANRDSLFKYHIAKVEEDEFEDEATLTHEDFVIGVRPECVSICENGALEGEIFSAMPTGMETTVKVRVGEFLFTGVVFGGITYKIGQKVRVSFTGENVLLFSRENGKLITRGTLKI